MSDFKGNYDARKWLSALEKETKGYGPIYVDFYKRRELLESIALSAKAAASEINCLCINGRLEDTDEVIKAFFDGVEQKKVFFGYTKEQS